MNKITVEKTLVYKICIFTGTRAEYGLLRGLILALQEEKQYQVTVLVSGMHLSSEFGNTIQEILKDGIPRIEKCEVLLSSDTAVSVTKAIGLGLLGYAEILDRIKPDLVIGLGDRFELLAFATTAMIQTIPLLHIHGGELTYGAIDDSIRHAITKMAYYHAVSTQDYRNRVIQMGEQPNRVFTVGAIGIDNIINAPKASRDELEKTIPLITIYKKLLLVTLHPETTNPGSAREYTKILLNSLDEFSEYGIIFTGANADSDGRIINEMVTTYTETRKNCYFNLSLGMFRYLGLMQIVHSVIGNSSSGILEAPAMGVYSVDIGNRQGGRIRSESVLHCEFSYNEIVANIKLACSKYGTIKSPFENNPYWHGGAIKLVTSLINKISFTKMEPKKFYNIENSL